MIGNFKDLVAYRQLLKKTSFSDAITTYKNSARDTLSDLNVQLYRTPEFVELFDTYTRTEELLDQTEQYVTAHFNKIDAQMHTESLPLYDADYENLNNVSFLNPLEYRNRELEISSRTQELLVSRISSYINWNIPAVQLCPSSGNLTEHLVGCDPLYLLDIDMIHMNDIKKKFTQQYQNRLRYYSIGKEEIPDFSSLPSGQIGFVLAWSFFNYRTKAYIETSLIQLFKALRNGGAVIMSFNNCENPNNVDLVDRKYASFMLESDLVKLLKKIGYEVLSIFNKDSTISWIEIKKPGELASNRAGQALAAIIQKDNK